MIQLPNPFAPYTTRFLLQRTKNTNIKTNIDINTPSTNCIFIRNVLLNPLVKSSLIQNGHLGGIPCFQHQSPSTASTGTSDPGHLMPPPTASQSWRLLGFGKLWYPNKAVNPIINLPEYSQKSLAKAMSNSRFMIGFTTSRLSHHIFVNISIHVLIHIFSNLMNMASHQGTWLSGCDHQTWPTLGVHHRSPPKEP